MHILALQPSLMSRSAGCAIEHYGLIVMGATPISTSPGAHLLATEAAGARVGADICPSAAHSDRGTYRLAHLSAMRPAQSYRQCGLEGVGVGAPMLVAPTYAIT
jgi:hypothetical protein